MSSAGVLSVLSLGAGVQSSTLLLMALHGEIDSPDCAIFADTGWEPQRVYDWLEFLKGECAKHDFPLYMVTGGNILNEVNGETAIGASKKMGTMPYHGKRDEKLLGPMRRRCTWAYKVMPIRRKLKELLGGSVRGKHVEMWIGITTDEIARVKPSDVQYITHRWPLVERDMTRQGCLDWMKANGYPCPPRSACIGCPYHRRAMWDWMKRNVPDEFQQAVEYDTAIRDRPLDDAEAYLHSSCKPLDVAVNTDQSELDWGAWDEECGGMCGV